MSCTFSAAGLSNNRIQTGIGCTFGAVRLLNYHIQAGMGCTFGAKRNVRSTIRDGPKAQNHTSLRHRRRPDAPNPGARAEGPIHISIPYIALIKLDSVFGKKGSIFLLK